MNTLFFKVADPTRTLTTASARATARIAPTAPPTGVSGVWPITRQLDHPNSGDNCDQHTPGQLCMFWGNNGGNGDTSIGSFKEKLYLSEESQCDYYGPPTDNLGSNRDPNRPGSPCGSSSQKQSDVEYWMRNGFGGTLSPNLWIEVDGSGVQGNNYSQAMQDYVNAEPEGFVAGMGNYRSVFLVLWKRQGAGAERCRNNPPGFTTWNGQQTPDRVRVEKLQCFRFYSIASFTNSSEVWGHHASCARTTPPGSGPPSDEANTVQMTE